MATNDVLDRLEALLAKVKAGPVFNASGMMSTWDIDAYLALRNAAPALIRLARAAIALDGMDQDAHRHARHCVEDNARAAIKALGEVRL